MPIGRKSGSHTARRRLGASFHVTLVGAVLTLVGCTVGPHYKNPALKVNDSWNVNSPQISAQRVADSAWWKSFNDPTLERLIQLAYSQNLTLQVAGLRIMEARAVLGIAIGNQYPQNQISADVSRVGLSKNTVNKPPGFTRDYWNQQLSFDASWEADFWGKYRKAVKEQKAVYVSSIDDYQNALVSLCAEVARTYVAILLLPCQPDTCNHASAPATCFEM